MSIHKQLQSIRGGILFRAILFLLVLFALCSLAWMMLLPIVFVQALSNRTGFEVKVETLSANPFTAKLHLKGLSIRNPGDFLSRDFIEIRELRADADLASLLSDKITIDEAVVDVAQVALVKNQAGKSNALVFKERLTGVAPEGSSSATSNPAPSPSAKQKKFLIRKLDLRFDRLLLVEDASQKPRIDEMSINFSHSYANVTSPVQIAVPIVAKVTALGGTLGDFAGKLGPQALELAKKTTGQLRELGKKTGESLNDIFKSMKEKVLK